MKKKYIVLVVVSVCAIVGGYFYYSKTSSHSSTTTERIITVGTGSIRTTVKSTGKIVPIQTSTLTFARAGRITNIYKKVGSTVKTGDIIAEIDPVSASLDIKSAQLALSNAKNSYTALIAGSTQAERIQAQNTLSESKSRLTLLEKALENLLTEERNTLASTELSISTLRDKVSLAKGDLEYSQKNVAIDTTTNNLERDADNAFLLLEDIERTIPDIMTQVKSILHIEDKSSPIYGDLSSQNNSYKIQAESSYTRLITDFALYKASLLDLRSQTTRSFTGTLQAVNFAKTFLEDSATLVGSTMIYEIDASAETSSFPVSVHDSYKTTLRGYATTLNSKLSSVNTTFSTLKSYGSESLHALANKNSVAQKQSALNTAEHELANALASYEATKKSYASKILSAESDIRTGQDSIRLNQANYTDKINGPLSTQVVAAKNSISSAEIALEKSRMTLKDYQIIAPFDGTVVDVPWNVGDTISTNNSSTTTVGILVQNHSLYEIDLSLDQIDIVKIRAGMPAKIVLDAFPKENYTGSVASISAVPTVTSGVVSYSAKIILSITRADLYAQMSATVEVITAERDNVILVNSSAPMSSGERSFVRVINRDGSIERREVILGMLENNKIELLSGVTLGEKILVTSSGATTSLRTKSANSSFGGPPPGF